MKFREKDRSRLARWHYLIGVYIDGTSTKEETAELEVVLRNFSAARELYLNVAQVDSLLEEVMAGYVDFQPQKSKVKNPFRKAFVVATSMAAGVSILIGVALFKTHPRNHVATLQKSSNEVSWQSAPITTGSGMASGTILQITEGEIDLRFKSGAFVRLSGPAQFEISSDNGGFLHSGEVYVRIEELSAKGFTIKTKSVDFIDIGTEFSATASLDGYSQLHVHSGTVESRAPDQPVQLVHEGNSIGANPEGLQVEIQIEGGDGSPGFNFPTIPAPSSEDYADLTQAKTKITHWQTRESINPMTLLGNQTGILTTLFDGKGQSDRNKPNESFFFKRNRASGYVLVDLKDNIEIGKIHTYSWHYDKDNGHREGQRYIVWGARDELPAIAPDSNTNSSEGWSQIARVDTSLQYKVSDSGHQPPQLASAITPSNSSSLGGYRYLLFQILPGKKRVDDNFLYSFLGEIDIFATAATTSDG
ncbi:MAG: FecR domain-containing protein [Verrucomicrobiota bacterium]